MIYNYIKSRIILTSLAIAYFILLMLASVDYPIWLPTCTVLNLFHMECFGCGLNNAAIALLSGDFNAAKESNPLIFIYLAGSCGLIFYDFSNYCRMFGRSKLHSNETVSTTH